VSSIIFEIQKESMDSNTKLSNILRKALLIATKLELDNFKEWINSELNGYKKRQKIPFYRKVKGTVKAFNPYNGWIPVMVHNTDIYDLISTRNISQPVSELEYLKDKELEDGILQVPIPPDVNQKLFSNSEEYRLGMIPTLLIDQCQIAGILDSVRNEVLNWSLELEKQGILGEGMSFSTEEIKMANSVININTFKGVLGDVSSSNVQLGDYSSIYDALKNNGVSQKERNELENLFDQVKVASPKEKKSLIQKCLNWIDRNKSTIGDMSSTIKYLIESL